jgi:hypothetical protein
MHIGNHFGAVRNWVALQDDPEEQCSYCVVDYHSTTVAYDPKELRARSLELTMDLLACGIDPDQSALFLQSQVPEHTELGHSECNENPGISALGLQRNTRHCSSESIGSPPLDGDPPDLGGSSPVRVEDDRASVRRPGRLQVPRRIGGERPGPAEVDRRSCPRPDPAGAGALRHEATPRPV